MNLEPQKPFALINGRVILPDRIVDGLAVMIDHWQD